MASTVITFGVINGAQTPSIAFQLNNAAESLSPGVYGAELTAIFDNGDSHRISIKLTIPIPSGEYVGTLDAYIEDPLRRSMACRDSK